VDPNLTKAQRRRLKQLHATAHSRELSTELAKVESAFARWRSGEIDAFVLSDEIHRFHDGPSKELYVTYRSALEFPVANAIHRGIISSDEAGPEVMQALERHLAFLRSTE
jgi:hypothetical protein